MDYYTMSYFSWPGGHQRRDFIARDMADAVEQARGYIKHLTTYFNELAALVSVELTVS